MGCSRGAECDKCGLRSMGVNTQAIGEQYFEIEQQGVMLKWAVAAEDLWTLLNNMPRIKRGEMDPRSEIVPEMVPRHET
jgi:hypothetical protein